jgi:hypothetical protein
MDWWGIAIADVIVTSFCPNLEGGFLSAAINKACQFRLDAQPRFAPVLD